MTRILLIPGLICDGHVWQGCLAALAGHDVTVADLGVATDITAMAEQLLATHAGDLIVMGHSLGGRVAMEMARIAPTRLRGLALLNTGMAPLKAGELPKREAMIAFAHEQGMAALADHWLPPGHSPNGYIRGSRFRKLFASTGKQSIHDLGVPRSG